MDHRNWIAPTLAALAGLPLAACGGGGNGSGSPDLVPIPHIFSFDPPSFNFCKKDDEGRLEITVRNQGTAHADNTVTRVDFGPEDGHFDIDTPSMYPMEVEFLTQTIPFGCTTDCHFTITVDFANTEDEGSDENNNQVSGTCIG